MIISTVQIEYNSGQQSLVTLFMAVASGVYHFFEFIPAYKVSYINDAGR